MGQAPIPPHTRADIKWELEVGRSNEAISEKHEVSVATVKRYRKSLEEFGEVYIPKDKPGGRPHVLSQDHEKILLDYLDYRPHAYLDEMTWFLFDEFDLTVDEATVWRALRRLKWSRKESRFQAAQRNEELRTWWLMTRLPQWKEDQLIFLDESAACERTADRKYAWCPVGTRSQNTRWLKRSKRWSILPAYDITGYIACRIKQGSFYTDSFNAFVREDVLPLCGRAEYREPRSVIVLDNASIHRNSELQAMCQEEGVELVYLPPYSPDFNPIESSFSVLKAWIRRNQEEAIRAAQDEENGGFGRFLAIAIHAQEGAGNPQAMFRKAGIRAHY